VGSTGSLDLDRLTRTPGVQDGLPLVNCQCAVQRTTFIAIGITIMNTIYRIVWNVTLGKWVVASELAKGRKKKSSLKTAMLSLAVIGAMAGIGAPSVYAADIDMPSCVAGEDPHETGCVPTSNEQLMTPLFFDGGGNDNGFASSVAIGDGAFTGNSNAVAIGFGATANNTANVAIGYQANTTGSNAVSMGYNATANGNYSTSIGGGSSAVGSRASAFGTDAKALAGNATSVGNTAQAVNGYATALGNGAVAGGFDPNDASVALGNNQTALGSASYAGGNRSTAVGYNAKAVDANTTAIGTSANASGTDGTTAIGMSAKASAVKAAGEWSATSVGTNSEARGDGAVAFGDSAKAIGKRTAALGRGASAQQDDATAFGAGTNINAAGGTAIGSGAQVATGATNGVAIGFGSAADRGNAVSVGNTTTKRQVINVAAGTQDTDAVNLSQLKGTAQSVATALGGSASVNADGTVKAPSYTVADLANGGTKTVNDVGAALGQLNSNVTNLDGRVTAVAGQLTTNVTNLNSRVTTATRYFKANGLDDGTDDASALGSKAIAIGSGAKAKMTNTGGAIAIGDRAEAESGGAGVDNEGSVAMGVTAKSYNAGSVALGHNARAGVDAAGIEVATANYGVSIGTDTRSANGATAVGYKATADGGGSAAFGIRASATAANSVALGQGSVADRGSAVSVGKIGAGGQRQIINVAAGTADTDVVNVSQLKGTAQSVATALGGSASVNADGTVKAPEYTVADIANGGNKTVNNVGDALGQLNANTTNLDGRVTTNEGDIIDIRNQLGSGSIGLVQQDATSRDITVAAGTDGGRVDFTGTAGARKLAGVAEGELSSTSKEAVNGSQLFATNERVTMNEGNITAIDGRVTQNEGDIVTIGDRLTSTETNVTNLDGRVTKNEGDIVNIDGRVTTNEGDIIDIRNQLGNGSIGLVKQDATSRDITVAAGTDGGRVDFTGTAGARKLAGVAEGELSSTSKEAVNGSQLFATNGRVTKNEGDIIAIDGRVTQNEGDIVTIGDRVTGAESSITNLDGRVTINEGDITDIRNQLGSGSIGLVQQDATSRDITVAAGTDGGRVDFTGTAGARRLAGVAEGELSATSNEAVNGSQLFATNERVTKTEGDIINLDGRVTKNEGDIINLGDRINSGSVGLVRQAGANAAVTVAAGTGGTVVDLTGTDGTRQIKGVSEGTDDTDAVNVGQLKKAGLVGGDGSTLDAVVYDAGSNRGSVTFGGLGGTKLTNVMAGIVSATSTDAVNGSQLWILQDQVGKLGDRVTNIEVNGAPVPGPAPEGRDPAFAANGDGGPATATGKDSVAAGTGAKASADNSVAIGAGSVADRADTVSVGSVGHERVVSNVAAGEQRTDAANWGQVQDALATANRYTDDRFDGVNRRIGEVQRQANRGIAASAALINVTPYMPGKTVLNAGVANYRGESALGVGVSRWNDTGRVNFNAGVSAAAGDSPIFRMGVGVVLGD